MEEVKNQPTMEERMAEEIAQMPTMDHPNMRESMQLQKAAWIKSEVEKRRKQEDLLLEQVFQEQRLLLELDNDIDENLEHTKEGRKYRKDIKERMNRHVYDMNDLSEDKLEGMKHYNNAYYRGFVLAMFLLSAILSVFTVFLHGVDSPICLIMMFFTGVQAAVLVQEGKGIFIWSLLCKLIDAFIFPLMLVLFIGYELDYAYYGLILKYCLAGGLAVLVLSTLAYFLYNPYRLAKQRIRDAESMIRSVEKSARKQVKKNQKQRIKYEAKQEQIEKKAEEKEQKRQKRKIALEEKKNSFVQKFRRKTELETVDAETENVEEGNSQA